MITLYHNNRCSKSRAAKALLESSGHEFQTVYYLEFAPTVDKLLELLDKGEFAVTELVRFGDASAKALSVTKGDSLSDKQWCELLNEHPQLLERPIVETNSAAVIGRPIDNIQRLLESL